MLSHQPNKRPRESSPPRNEQPPKPSLEYPPDGADFCVVSSDGVAFGFTENQFRQSVVFNDMVAVGAQKSAIHLVDQEIETSSSVELLLDILAGKSFGALEPTFDDPCSSTFQCKEWAGCLLFAKKYEFTQAFSMGVTTCKALLYQCIDEAGRIADNEVAVGVFVVAACIDDQSLAHAAVDCMAFQWVDKNEELDTDIAYNHFSDEYGTMRTYLPHLDTSTWPLDYFNMIPSSYLWALGRAAHPCTARLTSSSADRSTWISQHFYTGDVPRRFRWFLKLAKSEFLG